MKIAIVTPYRKYPGGVETVNEILSQTFQEAGHSVDFVTADSYQRTLATRFMVKAIGLPFVTAARFKSVADRYDIVIANGEFSHGIQHPRAINLFHGSYKGYRDYLSKQWSLRDYLRLTKEAFIQASGARNKTVVAVSEFVRQVLESDGITVHEVIPNGVNTDTFRPTDAEKTGQILFVGSYGYYAKGFDVLEKLSEMGFSIDCVTNKNPGSKLNWIPNLDQSEMPEIYNRHRILVFPSRFEGLGMAPLEAMACGLPVVMSETGLGPHLRREIPEFVAESHAPEEFALKIGLIESNYGYFSRRAREFVERHYTLAMFKTAWLDLLERVANA